MDNRGNPAMSRYLLTPSTQTEGTLPLKKPSLISRSPTSHNSGDMERDMDRNSSKKPQSFKPKEPIHSGRSVNPRGPHYSGTYSQHSSSTSTYPSLSDSSSGHSHQTDLQPLHSENPQHYGYQHNMGRPNSVYNSNQYPYNYGDVTQASQTQHQQYTQQHVGRPCHETMMSTNYYSSREQKEFEGPNFHQLHAPPYRHTGMSRYSTLIKAYSEERVRDIHPYESERGFSSLGELPNQAHQYRVDPLQTSRQPMMSQYRYQREHPRYRDVSPALTQYTTGSGYSTGIQSSLERTEEMRLHSQSDSDIEILNHPLDQTVNENDRVVFKCEARVHRCKEEPYLLWFKDREPLYGEVDSTYVIEETTEKDAGVYHCLVTHPLNMSNQKESYPATLTVNTEAMKSLPSLGSLPWIVKQPLGKISATVGEPLEVSIEASGQKPISYQWYRNSIPMNFAQSAILRFPEAAVTHSGDYCCRVANENGSILSKVFTLEVTRVKAMPTPDLSDAYLQQISEEIACQVRNEEELAHCFGVCLSHRTNYKSSKEYITELLRSWRDTERGTKQQLLTILKQHHIMLNEAGGSQQFSQPHTAILQFVKQPQSKRVPFGQSVNLQVAVSRPTPSLRYQWFQDGHSLTGRTSPNLSISSVVDSDVGEYMCVASSNELQVRIYSEPAVIELADCERPQRVLQYAPQNQIFEPPKCSLINRAGPTPVTKIEIMPNIVIEEHPTSVEIEPGDPLTLRCKASCPRGQLKYSWYFNGLFIEEEQSEYVLNCFTDEDEGDYWCVVSNQFGSVTSNRAQVKAKLDSD